MYQRLLLAAACLLAIMGTSQAQTTVLDFEAPATSTNFFYFGSSLDGTIVGPVANPDQSGINVSDSVMMHIRPDSAESFAGAFSDPNPMQAVDVTNGEDICMKVWLPAAGTVRLKLEQPVGGGDTWELEQSVANGGQWTEVCFSSTMPSAVNPNVIASGNTYNRMVMFFNFGQVNSPVSDTFYFDDVVLNPVVTPPPPMPGVCNTILDFEDAATTTNFFYFGSSLDGTIVGPVANPDMSGINMSDSVMMHIRPDSAESFAGAFSDPNPMTPFDLTNGEEICMNVWLPAAGTVRLKLEQPVGGGDTWELEIPVANAMQWEEICFDSNLPSTVNPNVFAAGKTFNRMVIFFNFGQVNSPVSDTFYFDNICTQVPVVNPPMPGVCNTVLDFEDAATTTNFFYFGSSLDGTIVGPVANPDMSGINMSDSVMMHIRPDSAESFAGAFSDPNPMTPFDLTNGEEICMNVWLPAAGTVRLKLEQPIGGGDTWELELPVANAMQWEEICFDSNEPSTVNPNVFAAGTTFERMVIFFNFGQVNSPVSDTFYFDNICTQVPVVNPPMPGVCNTVLDFEDAATTTNFFYFGSSLDGTIVGPVANPDMSGINMSDSVMMHIRPDSAESFAGAFSDPNPMTPFDLTNGEEICMNVWLPAAGTVRLKLEQPIGGGDTWELELPVANAMQWEEICFDSNEPSTVNPNVFAAGTTFERMVIFFNFGQVNSPVSDTFYFDNVCLQVPDTTMDPPPGPTVCNTILDFEEPMTSTDFFYFGSTLDGTTTGPVANPDMSGINMSDSVMIHIRPDSAESFAGAFSDPNPMTPIDVTTGGDICMDVWMPAGGTVRLKLEQSTTGSDNWELERTVSSSGMWENVCFDPNEPSAVNPGVVAAGNSFNRMVIFFNFGQVNSPVSDTFYFDNVCVEMDSMPTVDSVNVNFALNLNGYTGSGTTPFVTGTFDGFSANTHALSDDDMDGIWTTTVRMVPQAIEWKYVFDGSFAIQEQFNGTEACVMRDPSGAFVNRFNEISSDTTLATVCWNSCYDCGQAVQITFNLGFPDGVTPSMDGVWLAGGGNFTSPGGEFDMDDSDGDGIYTITVERGIGFGSFYTFANGNCPDFSCKENIQGQPCSDPNNFDDRTLPPVMADTVINTCFGVCSDSTDCSIVGIRDQLVNNFFSLAPNPGLEYTMIEFEGSNIMATQIEVMDVQGRTVYTHEVAAGESNHRLELNNWTAGIYMVMLRQGAAIGIQKLKVE